MKRDSATIYDSETARYSRWFSKDSELTVFFDAKKNAIPITRREQDECIAQAENLTVAYSNQYKTTKYIGNFVMLAFGLLLTLSSNWFTDFILSFLPGNYLPISLFLIVFSIFVGQEIYYRHKMDSLRAHTADQLWSRNSITKQSKRVNAFRIIQGIVAVTIFPLTFVTFSEAKNPTYFVLWMVLLVILVFVKFAADKVDKTQTSQTGKWFRNW